MPGDDGERRENEKSGEGRRKESFIIYVCIITDTLVWGCDLGHRNLIHSLVLFRAETEPLPQKKAASNDKILLENYHHWNLFSCF